MSHLQTLKNRWRRQAVLAGACLALAGWGPGALAAPDACEGLPQARPLIQVEGAPERAGLAVLMLPGISGLEAFRDAYLAHGRALVGAGMQVYMLDYDPEAASTRARQAQADFDYATHMRCWAQRASQAVDALLRPPVAARRVAVLAFSQGARVAVAAAAVNPRLARLVTLYGRLPRDAEMLGAIGQLPPLLNLHGDADSLVPIEEGRRLVSRAQDLGGEAAMVQYPGEGHGFDFAEGTQAAADARRRILAFMLAGAPPSP